FNNDLVIGSILWSKFRFTEDYYITREDNQILLQQVIPSIKDLGLACNAFIDLGPGDKDALKKKTIPLIKNVDARNYYSVDLCSQYAKDAAQTVSDLYQIHTHAAVFNFLEDQLHIDSENSLLFMGGSTISNIPLDIHTKDATLFLSSTLAKLTSSTARKRYLLIGFDANQDKESLSKSYNNAIHARMVEDVIWRIRRDTQFDINPHDFEYFGEWLPKENRYAHFLKVKRDCTITGPYSTIRLLKGQRLHVDNSFKFPLKTIEQAAWNAGWHTKQIWTLTGRVHYILLER